MTISLIIATYNWPEALEQVLESVKRQTRVPDEVLVADDGSGEPTRAVVERFQKAFPCPLIHVWHEDIGFRLAEIRNRAIERSRGDYIIQIDGDCIADSRFVEDHAREAKRGCFCSGGRILCGEELSRRILSRERKNFCRDIFIGEHVWLTAGVCVLKGSKIGDHCVVGSRSLVIGDCSKPNSIYAGVPAKFIKSGIDWER